MAVIWRLYWLPSKQPEISLSKMKVRGAGNTGHSQANTACHGKPGSQDWQFLNSFLIAFCVF